MVREQRIRDCKWRGEGKDKLRSCSNGCYHPEGPYSCPYRGNAGWWQCELWEEKSNDK